jgi:hypothetical protein
MEISKPKTLDDFPKFVVTAVRRLPVSDNGKQWFELEGRIDATLEDRFDEIMKEEGGRWFWLLFGESECLCPELKSFDKQTRTAILSCDEDETPTLLGSELAYLSPYWQAFNVWMVLDPNWGWERRQFLGSDAVAETYEADDVSIVEGREVRVWTKLSPTGGSSGQSRYYSAADETLSSGSGPRLVPGGWDHEHCQLCNEHVDAGMFGYCDPRDRWMCEKCYERYVARRDLAFVDEL